MEKNLPSIEFDFAIDNSTIIVHLQADVQMDESEQFFIIDNFRIVNHNHIKNTLLPKLLIKRKDEKWVHIDTGKVTTLSKIVGKTIEGLNFPPLVGSDKSAEDIFEL